MKYEQDDPRPPAAIWRSMGAVGVGLVIAVIPSLLTDHLFHLAQFYPPWGTPMTETVDNLMSLTYRLAYTILAGYLAARLAPSAPLRHALALGFLGTALAGLGAVVNHQMAPDGQSLSPSWYSLALVITALPAAWLGGRLGGAGWSKRH